MKFSFLSIVIVCLSGTIFFSCSKNEVAALNSPTTSTADLNDPIVSTPIGYFPSSHVHEVNSTSYGSLDNNQHIVIKSLGTGKTLQDLKPASDEEIASNKTGARAYGAVLRQRYGISSSNMTSSSNLISTPGANNELAYEPSNNTLSVVNTNSSSATNITGTQLPYYVAIEPDQTNIQSFSTTWTVPAKPFDTTNIQVCYLWNGVDNNYNLIQPVLGWDQTGIGKYTICNWYFLNGNAFHGAAIDVQPGTSLTGVMNLVSHPNDTTYIYHCGFIGYPSADVTIVRPTEIRGVIESFEYRFPFLISTWPNQPYSAMTNINLTLRSGSAPSTIAWSSNGYSSSTGRTTPSGINTLVVNNSSSNGEIDFYFGDGTGITPDSTFQIISALNGTSVLDVTGGATTSGTPVELWTNNSPISSNQCWTIKSLGNGYYKLVDSKATSQVLTVVNSSSANGTQIEIATDNGSTAQKWLIKPASNGYCTLSPACAPSSALDIYSHLTANGTKVEIWTNNGGHNQQFKFAYVPVKNIH